LAHSNQTVKERTEACKVNKEEGDRLIMGYFNHLDNEFLNKYKKYLKIKNN
jgi:hypothetical protein